MLRSNLKTTCYKGLNYLLNEKGNRIIYKPWLGDIFSIFYDRIMEKNIFPKKFEADILLHNKIMKGMLYEVSNCKVLELAAGSGSIINFLDNTNSYTATDISPSLLRIAKKKLNNASYPETSFFVMNANQLAFEAESFDACVCVLSLNFFLDIPAVVRICFQVLKDGGKFYCCVPVPERNESNTSIRGTLHSVKELREIFEQAGFLFFPELDRNGTLLYFKAEKRG